MRAQLTEFESIKEWKSYCFSTHKLYVDNTYFTSWIKEKNVYIFNHGLSEEDAGHVKNGIEKAIALIGLHFKVECAKHKFYDIKPAIENGTIVGKVILKMIAKARKQSNNSSASIFIVDKPIKSQDAVLDYGEALTYVSEGITIFAFDPSVKYSPKFLTSRAMHEAFHLLGLNVHHEETRVKGYKQPVSCNMEYDAPSGSLCAKCNDALKSFWKGIEHATKKQFVKS